MPEDHAYIKRSAFIYCNYLSGLYNLPATPKTAQKLHSEQFGLGKVCTTALYDLLEVKNRKKN
jgi:hypothetical protein